MPERCTIGAVPIIAGEIAGKTMLNGDNEGVVAGSAVRVEWPPVGGVTVVEKLGSAARVCSGAARISVSIGGSAPP